MRKRQGLVWNIQEETFKKYVEESKFWIDITRKIGYTNHGNLKVVRKRIEELNLDTSHIGLERKKPGNTIDLKDILIENSTFSSMVALKKKLIKELNWELECSCCKLSEWQGQQIPIEIDHINGIHTDNRIENLRFICPNCHALTPTYKGKNRKINCATKSENYCKFCQIPILEDSTTCKKCHNNYLSENIMSKRKVLNRPSLEQLNEDLENLKTYVAVAKKYQVTDNTIRKWIRLYKDEPRIKISNNPRKEIIKPSLETLENDLRELKTYTAVCKKHNVDRKTIKRWIEKYKEE